MPYIQDPAIINHLDDLAARKHTPMARAVSPAIEQGMRAAAEDVPPVLSHYLELKRQAAQLPQYSPLGSAYENFMAGAGRSVVETGRGLGQLAGIIPQSQIDEARRLDQPLMDTGAGQLGNIAGSVAQMATPGLALKGAGVLPGVAGAILNPRTAAQAAAAGGLFSAAQPTVTGESRGLNAALGAAGGAAGQKLASVVTQGVGKASPYIRDLSQKASKLGMKLTPGQAAKSVPLRQMEASFESNPLTSGWFSDLKSHNQAVLNRTAAHAIGEDTDEITEYALGAADKRIKGVFRKVFRGKDIAMPKSTLGEIEDISTAYTHSPTGRGDATFKHVVDYLNDELAGGNVSGEKYLNIHNELTKVVRNAWRGENANPELAQSVQDIIDVLDSQSAKTLSAKELSAWSKARTQWGNKVKIESSLNGANVSGPKLANLLKRKDKTGFLRGGGRSDKATQDLYTLAHFADNFRGLVGDSGTPTRLAIPNLVSGSIGGGGIGGLLAHQLGLDPVTGALVGGAAGPALMKGLEAGYTSAPMRGLLTYGGMNPGSIPSLIQGGLPKAATEALTPEAGPPRRR